MFQDGHFGAQISFEGTEDIAHFTSQSSSALFLNNGINRDSW